MNAVLLTATLDISRLERAIPEFLRVSKRSMQQQCVTSMAFICFNALELTPHTEISRIDSDLEATAFPAILKSGERSQNKKRQRENIHLPERSRAAMIVLARMHPGSKYNQLTGDRWALPKLPASNAMQGVWRFWEEIDKIAVRMIKARHSSTHFLKSGWLPAIRKLLASKDYIYFGGGIPRSSARNNPNELNRLDPERLGFATIDVESDVITVSAVNKVGEAGNETLDRKHRQALIIYGLPAAQRAVNQESASLEAKLRERLAAGYDPIQRLLN